MTLGWAHGTSEASGLVQLSTQSVQPAAMGCWPLSGRQGSWRPHPRRAKGPRIFPSSMCRSELSHRTSQHERPG